MIIAKLGEVGSETHFFVTALRCRWVRKPIFLICPCVAGGFGNPPYRYVGWVSEPTDPVSLQQIHHLHCHCIDGHMLEFHLLPLVIHG